MLSKWVHDKTPRVNGKALGWRDRWRTGFSIHVVMVKLARMTSNTAIAERAAVSQPHDRVRTVEAIHRSTAFHWVGDGFTSLPTFQVRISRPSGLSPFPTHGLRTARTFQIASKWQAGCWLAPASRVRTVTLAWEGSVAHRDNAGHKGVIGPGDVQWMTAASGIFHEEYHEEQFTRQGGRMHMMQLWVNLPKKDKAAPPAYQPIESAAIPQVQVSGGGNARVIAGEYAGARGPARTFTPITMLDVSLSAGNRLPIMLPPNYNVLAVVAKGRLSTGHVSGGTGELIVFNNDGASIELTAEEDTHVIVLSGEPIHEPIIQYGPFVMNTVGEIQQAILDANSGKFGPVPD